MARIAVVDDNRGARHFAAAALKPQGHEVVEVEPSCLFEVLSALHPNPPDLLITDLVMPGCPGQTLVRACREDAHFKDMKIILLTAHADAQLAHFIQTLGQIHFLSKPVAPADLSDCVERYLSGNLEVDPGWALDCKGTVAVVDDSRLSRTVHAAALKKAGFRPVEIDPLDLSSTLQTLEEQVPDLLLLDYLMPRFKGDALIRAVRASKVEALREIPVLMVTAHHEDDLEGFAQRMMGVEVAFKPVGAEELAQRVRNHLKG